MTYSIHIVDTRTGERLGACDGLPSAHAAGLAAVDAYTVLVGGDGHDPAHLGLGGVEVEDCETRGLTPAEESAMVAALDQFAAERADES